ncbi:CPBP family intramembrane glutamic endopeptidase [Lysobacter enzymogenes]|uniref:CPBP family intramembrane glutamic endopeptidase n=1 Tax=Lysobacter enzymogenes TaxID=69 RepID=UPI0019CFA330|nr:CPBP family intramembrane glutamic endopeptidase [Lysobacter enzymogenes]
MSIAVRNSLKAVVRALGFCAAAALVLVLASIAAKNFAAFREEIVVGAVGVALTFALTAIFLRCERRGFSDVGLAWRRGTLAHFGIGCALGGALLALHVAAMSMSGKVSWTRNESVDASGMVAAAVGYLLLALREEMAFRAYPLRTLLPALGAVGAQGIVFAVFVLEHRLGGASWINAIFGAGLGALVFGMAALATRGIALPFGMHVAWNFGDWLRGGKGNQGGWVMHVDEAHTTYIEIFGLATYAVIMLLALTALIVLYRRADTARHPHSRGMSKSA